MSVLDRSRIGLEFPRGIARVERGRIKLFARAIGETDPVYSDPEVARTRGFPDIPIPPTYLYTLELEREPAIDPIAAVGAQLGQLLHGEQCVRTLRTICAGEEISFQTRIADIFAKHGGRLEFVILETEVLDAQQILVAELRATFVIPRVVS